MKKILSLLLVFLLILVGCNSKEVQNNENIDSQNEKDDFEKTMEELQKEYIAEYEAEYEKNKPTLIEADKLPYEIVHMDDKLDSAGSAYVYFVFHNNSEFPIVRYELSGRLKDTNEKTYYVYYLTVMPNETSAQFDSFAPTSLNVDDIDIQCIRYYYFDSNDRRVEVEYDVYKDEYYTTTTPIDRLIESLNVEYEQLPFEFVGIDSKADQNGFVHAYLEFTNNSEYPIENFSIDAIRTDSNKKTHFTCRDTVQPGETSPTIKGVAPATFNMDDLKLIQISYDYIENGKTKTVHYDLQLNEYTYVKESLF